MLSDIRLVLNTHADTLRSLDLDSLRFRSELDEDDVRQFIVATRDKLRLDSFRFPVGYHPDGGPGYINFPRVDRRFYESESRLSPGGFDLRDQSEVHEGEPKLPVASD